MLAGTLAFVVGIYCLLQFSTMPSFGLLLFIPFLFIASRFFSLFRYPLLFSLGFCWALIRIDHAIEDALPDDVEGRVITLTGVIASLPKKHDNGIQFLFDVNETGEQGKRTDVSGLVRLNWYKTDINVVPGEKWQLAVKLKRPYSFMNPGGFDYETWILRQGINATGYVRKSAANQRLGITSDYYLERMRYHLAQKIIQFVDEPLLGFVLALSLGDRSQINPEQWRTLTQTGTNHLIAISGLHLGLIAGLFYFIGRTLWSRFYFATQCLPATTVAAISAFSAAFVYAALAGFALPTQRALIMIGVFLFGLFSVKQWSSVKTICIAVIFILIIEPLSILAVDFWLSFSAVILIFYITRCRHDKHSNLRRWLRLQCLLSLALFPFLIFWFKQVPLYSVLANLVAIPVISFLIVPLVFIATSLLFISPTIAEYLYSVIESINHIYWMYLEFLAEQQHAVIPIATPNLWTFSLALLGVFILLMPKGLPGRWVGLVYLIPLLFPILPRLQTSEFKLSHLDVGQGLSAVIETRNHVLVYDTGAKFSERFNTGDAVLIPYLRHKGIRNISMLVISHGDNDHIGGADALIKQYNIDRILSSVPEKTQSAYVERCVKGQKWYWDEVKFEILHPSDANDFTGNNASCVLKVSSAYGAVLLTGDIEKEAENGLVAEVNEQLKADILLVPHHGSRTSSTPQFINAVMPRYAFFSVGYRNRFGFPKQDIISRYNTLGVETLISYITGELSVKFTESGLAIEQYRSKKRRFWHH